MEYILHVLSIACLPWGQNWVVALLVEQKDSGMLSTGWKQMQSNKGSSGPPQHRAGSSSFWGEQSYEC